MKKFQVKWLSVVLAIVLVINLVQFPVVHATDNNIIELNYSFGSLCLSEGDNGKKVSIDGLSAYNQTGMPDLPSKTVKVLLPAGKKVKSIQVKASKEQVYKDIIVEPAKAAGVISNTISYQDDTLYNYEVYEGSEKYPYDNHSNGKVSDTRGFSVFTMMLYPVTYQNKILSYTPNMQVRIKLADDNGEKEYYPIQGDEVFLDNNTENIEAVTSYYKQIRKMNSPAVGVSLLGNVTIDYIIITNSTLAPKFQTLADYKATKGLATAVVKTEDIYASYTGRDNAEKIRNFIKEAYQVNKIKYVLLGGDGDNASDQGSAIIPTRVLHIDSIEDTKMPAIAADIYYGCLQGDYDSNANNIFGEVTDGEKGKDVDLTYDVYVGRAPVDDITEADNFIQKTINYERSQKAETALMIGEQLQGNYSCSIDLATSLPSAIKGDKAANSFRKLRDSSVKKEYVDLYYRNNDFMKQIFTSNIGLLADFSGILLEYHKPIKNYLDNKDNFVLGNKDASRLIKFCESLEKAIHNSKTKCDDKEEIIAIIQEMSDYISKSQGKTLSNIIENSKYYGRDVKPLEADIFGGDYKEEIRKGSNNEVTTKGIPSSYKVGTLYDTKSSSINKSQVLDALNQSPQLINHLGHADTDGLMKLKVKDVQELNNTSAFFLYSQGCYAGSFDNMQANESYSNADCIAEELVVSNKISGAFAAVVNSRYGWYDRKGTNGPSQIFDRWFWDGIYTQNYKNLGRLLSYSKENVLDRIANEEHGTVLRFCYYTINLLGDPETELTRTVSGAIDPNIPNQLSATLNNKDVSLTWNTVKDALEYQVLRYDSSVKDYVKIATTSSTNYTTESIWGNNVFVVCAVKADGVLSGYSNQIIINNTIISGFKLKSQKKQVNLSWKTVAAADGYYIYRATSINGKYTKVKTISKNSTTSYIDKVVKSKKQYYYKVCAYKAVNNKKVPGEYTNIESIKVK